MSNLHAFYLRDLGYLLREAGEAVKHDVAAASDDDDRVFQQGRQMAYYEVLSLMQQQAYAFELPLSEIALDGLNPDHDLL
jgi:hypothetical protein